MTTDVTCIEYWFTAPSKEAALALITRLGEHDMVFGEGPWDPFGGDPRPERPWSLVGNGSSALDPALVAGIAFETDCRYHADGGYGRW